MKVVTVAGFVILVLLLPKDLLGVSGPVKMKTQPLKMTGLKFTIPLKIQTDPLKMTGLQFALPLQINAPPLKMTGLREFEEVTTDALEMTGMRGMFVGIAPGVVEKIGTV